MVNLVFEKEDEFTFMMLNLFVHDFLHDFNASKFSKRLSKISSYIDKISNEIDVRVGRTIQSNKKVEPEEESSNKKVALEKKSSNKKVEPEEESSNKKVALEKKSSNKKVAPEKKSSNKKVALEEESSNKIVAPEKKSSNKKVALEEESSNKIVEPEEESSNKKVAPEEKQTDDDVIVDVDIDDKKINEYECFGENETGTNLNYLISHINDVVITKDNIEKINKILNFEGSITRSRAKMIQWAKNFVDETKLYVLGLFNLNKLNELKYFGGRINNYGRTKKHGRNKKNALTKKRNYLKIPQKIPKKIPNNFFQQPPKDNNVDNILENNVENIIENKQIFINENYFMLRNFVINGIESAMYYSKDYKELSDYFQFFGKLYLYYENENMNPLDTFNLSLIDDILVLYLLDKEKTILNDIKLYDVLDNYNQLIQNNELKKTFVDKFYGRKTTDNEIIDGTMLGGTIEEEIIEIDKSLEVINNTFPEFFTPEFFTPETDKAIDLDKLYSKTIDYSNYIQENPYIKKNKIQMFIDNINKSKDQYNRARERIKKQSTNLYIDSMNKLLIYIRQSFIDKKTVLSTKIEKESNNGDNKLTTTQSSHVQRISVSVAQGGIDFILKDEYKTVYNKKNNNKKYEKTMLDYEYDIIKNIAEQEKGFTRLDTNIRENFDSYSNNSGKVIKNIDKLKQVINNNRTKNKKNGRISVINNAATNILKDILGNKFDTEVICPTSSRVDAMGSMGSCSGEELRKHPKEFHNMNFTITYNNDNDGNYYQGNTIIEKKNGSENLKIFYSATCNEFVLPYVELKIDMSTSTVVTLSANNTFKNVIDRILTIWNIELGNKKFDDEEILWQLLENKRIYIDLISTGSLKGIGDFYQEINSTLENGGYDEIIEEYFENHLRIGANGDQPSGIRAGFVLLKGIEGVHNNSIAGYLADDNNTSIMISRQPITGGVSRKKISKKSNRKTLKKSI